MFGFLKQPRQLYRVRLLKDNLVRRFNGKCLIRTHTKGILIWMNENDIQDDGDYIEFSIDANNQYFVSFLNTIATKGYNKSSGTQISGIKLKKLFDIDLAHNYS